MDAHKGQGTEIQQFEAAIASASDVAVSELGRKSTRFVVIH